MASITFKGNPVETSGTLPAIGSKAPAFTLVKDTLADTTAAEYAGKKKVLNIFPSLDTGVCAMSVRTFNKLAAGREGVAVLNISADLPFAMKRFCAAEGIAGAEVLSTFRSTFAKDFGLELTTGPLRGLCSRVVIVLGEHDDVIYSEQVPEIAQEPNYEAALAKL